MIDRELCLYMYNSGTTLQEIGDFFEVSRQRVWQIIKPMSNVSISRTPHGIAIHSRPEEIYIIDVLREKHFTVEPQGYNSPFDLLVNGKMIEIKYSSKTNNHTGTEVYTFNYLFGRVKPDFYILVCGEIPSPKYIYILPYIKATNHMRIMANPKNKQAIKKMRLYNLNWKKLRG